MGKEKHKYIYCVCVYISDMYILQEGKKGHEEDAKERERERDGKREEELRVFNGKGHVFLCKYMFGK